LIRPRGVSPLPRETTQSRCSLGPSQIHTFDYPGAYLYGDFHCTLDYQSDRDAHLGFGVAQRWLMVVIVWWHG
jgi:hypothetical protein